MKRLWLVTAAVALAVVVFLGAFSKVSKHVGIDDMMRDAQAISGNSPWFAMGSDLGMYGWVSTISMAVLAILLALQKGAAVKSHVLYLSSIICLTSVLLIDDRLMLHESYFPVNLGIDERLVILGIGCLATLFFVVGAPLHHLGGWPLLLTSATFFALSILIDLIEPEHFVSRFGEVAIQLHFLIEDGLKLTGIMFWLVFSARAGMRVVMLAEMGVIQPEPSKDVSVTGSFHHSLNV